MKDFLSLAPILKLVKKLKKQSSFYFFIVSVVLSIILLILALLNKEIENQIQKRNISSLPLFSLGVAPYPQIRNVLGAESQNIILQDELTNLTAKSALIMDDNSKVILFLKNPDVRFSMASTTKIMTALTALEYFKLDDILTIQTKDVEGVVVGFKKGEKISFENLLYAMLLSSGNDAALAIAQNYPKGEGEFINKMNENAASFNLINTHFSDSIGLNDEGDYTTAIDLARLSSVALKNKTFSQIVSTKYKLITNANGTNTYSLYNLNKLLGVDGVNGVKTGFTDEAGGVLVTSKTKDDHTFIIIVMKSQDRFLDTQRLLSIINGNIAFLKFDY